MKKNFFVLIALSLILSACSNSKNTEEDNAIIKLPTQETSPTSPESSEITSPESSEIGGSFGTQFTTDQPIVEELDQEILDMGFKGPEFYTELFNEARNSMIYTGLNIQGSDDSIEKFLYNEGKLTYIGRFAKLISSYLESIHSYTDTDKLYPSYALKLNDTFYGSQESINYFMKRYEIYKIGNKFQNEQISEIKIFSSKDKEGLTTYLNNYFPVSDDKSPTVLISNFYFKDEIVPRELFTTKNDKILSTFLIYDPVAKMQFLCGLQSTNLIPLSNLPDTPTESYKKFYDSIKSNKKYTFLFPDYSNLEHLIRAYILPGLICFNAPGK